MNTRPIEENAYFQLALQDDQLDIWQDRNKHWWFREKIHRGWGQAIEIDEFVLHTKTDYQTLVIFKNNRLGHVMLLDGAVQIAENNWHTYQEYLAICPILPQYENATQPMEVLIIGGGDGGVATVISNLFPTINVTMVEIDSAVVEAGKTYFPEISACLNAPPANFNLIIGNGVEFVANPTNKNRFSAIIVDCTDPGEGSPADGLFGETFQANAKNCLVKDGIFLQQSGTLDFQVHEVKAMASMMKKCYQHPIVLPINMMTYPGTMTLVGGSDININKLNHTMIEQRFQALNLPDKVKSFTTANFIRSINSLPAQHQKWLNSLLRRSNNASFFQSATESFPSTTSHMAPEKRSKNN